MTTGPMFCKHEETEIAWIYKSPLVPHRYLGYICRQCGEPLPGLGEVAEVKEIVKEIVKENDDS